MRKEGIMEGVQNNRNGKKYTKSKRNVVLETKKKKYEVETRPFGLID